MTNTEKLYTLIIEGEHEVGADDREDLLFLLEDALRRGKKAFIRNNL